MKNTLFTILLFLLLLIVTIQPARWIQYRINRRIHSHIHQSLIDIKRQPMEALETTLQEIHHQLTEVLDGYSADEAIPWSELSLSFAVELLEGNSLHGRLTLFDAEGQTLRTLTSGEESEEREPEEGLTLAVGNAIRGLRGFSLRAYSDAWGRSVYGCWRWDRQWRFGMALEIPADEVESLLVRPRRNYAAGQRYFRFMCIFGYLAMLLMIARLAVYLAVRRIKRISVAKPQ